MDTPHVPFEVDPRIEQAVERTLLAWVRTGLAIIGLGFVVARFGLFLREMAAERGQLVPASHRFTPVVGVSLILLGVAAMVVQSFRFVRTISRLRQGKPAPLSVVPGVFTTIFLAGIGFALALYLLDSSG